MAFEQISGGLNFKIPTKGTKNWAQKLKTLAWQVISGHRHTGSGDGNQIPTGGLENNAVTTAKLAKNIGQHVATTLTPAGTTQDIDFNNGNVQTLDLGAAPGDVTVTLTNPAAGHLYTIWMIQGAVARDVIWPAAVKWPGGQKPILSSTNDAVDKVTLYYDGATYRGDWDTNYS